MRWLAIEARSGSIPDAAAQAAPQELMTRLRQRHGERRTDACDEVPLSGASLPFRDRTGTRAIGRFDPMATPSPMTALCASTTWRTRPESTLSGHSGSRPRTAHLRGEPTLGGPEQIAGCYRSSVPIGAARDLSCVSATSIFRVSFSAP
jgi:hypothetical protein